MNEWDDIAHERYRQILNRIDISTNEILYPVILENLQINKNVIDIGCGTGNLTNLVSEISSSVTGIDSSCESIKIAQANFSDEKTTFQCSSIETFKSTKSFDIVVSNMVANNCNDLRVFLDKCYEVLNEEGIKLFTIPHPCFWFEYRKYENFNYQKTISIKAEFKIQTEQLDKFTTYFHYTLEKYLQEIFASGFKLIDIKELYGENFNKPKFIFMKLQK